jgi:hypothetical protein
MIASLKFFGSIPPYHIIEKPTDDLMIIAALLQEPKTNTPLRDSSIASLSHASTRLANSSGSIVTTSPLGYWKVLTSISAIIS